MSTFTTEKVIIAKEAQGTGPVAGWVMFVVLWGLILWRLFVWKFFFGLEPFVKEDLTNVLCAVPILIVAGLYYGWKTARNQPLQDRRTGIEWALWAYFAASAFSIVFSVDRIATVRYAVVLFSYLVFFFMLVETLDDGVRRQWFFLLFLALSLLIAGWGIRDYLYLIGRAPDPSDKALENTNDSLYYILLNKRACSFFGWPNVLAGYLGLAIPLGLAAALTWRALWAKLAAGISIAVMLVTLFLTFSFLGWLSFLVGFVAAMAVFFFRQKDVGRSTKIALILFSIAAAALFTVVVVKKNFSIAVGPRQQYFIQSVRAIKEHPLLGTGLDTFRYASTKLATDKGGVTAFAHNSYLQIWVESGILGFLAVLVLVFFVLRKFHRLAWRSVEGVSDRYWAVAFVWAFTAVFVDNLWSFTFVKPNISIFFWVVLGYACSFDTSAVARKKYALPVRSVIGWLAFLVIVVVLVVTVRATATQWMCRQAFVQDSQGLANDALQSLKQARRIDPKDARIAFEIGKRYVQGFQQSGDRRFLALAEQELLDASENSPFYGSRLLLGLIYRSQGRAKEGRDWISEAYQCSALETERDVRAIMASQTATQQK